MYNIADIVVYAIAFISLYFQIFLLITFIERKKEIQRDEQLSPRRYPSATIVVPCWNEERTVSLTIDSLLALNYPKQKLHIVVVDDGSTDNTLSVLERFRSNPQIEIITKENGGKHTAVNLALSKCQTELFGCLDADSFVHPEALRRIAVVFEDKNIMAVTPCMQVRRPKTVIQMAQRVEYTIGIFFKMIFGRLSAIQVTPGPFSIFRKKVFDDLGPYKKAYNTEDFEIALRMHKHHYKIANAHKAFVYTNTPPNPYALFRQRLRWMQGSLLNMMDYRSMILNPRHGFLGLAVLPMAILYYFFALYVSGYVLFRAGEHISNIFQKINTVGFTVPNFELFYLETGALSLVTLLVLGIAVFVFGLGARITEEKASMREFILFLVIYPMLAPLWLWRAGFDAIRNKSNSWR